MDWKLDLNNKIICCLYWLQFSHHLSKNISHSISPTLTLFTSNPMDVRSESHISVFPWQVIQLSMVLTIVGLGKFISLEERSIRTKENDKECQVSFSLEVNVPISQNCSKAFFSQTKSMECINRVITEHFWLSRKQLTSHIKIMLNILFYLIIRAFSTNNFGWHCSYQTVDTDLSAI